MISGYLRLIVMKTLLNRKFSGYGLIKQIEKNSSWKPSFGSIYPLLDKLLKEKLVEFEVQGREKLYFLTNEGKKHLSLIDKNKNTFVDKLIAHWKAFSRITDKKEMGFMMEVLNSVKRGKLPFSELNPEIGEFRATLFDAYLKEKDRKKIKSVLRETVRKLKSIK